MVWWPDIKSSWNVPIRGGLRQDPKEHQWNSCVVCGERLEMKEGSIGTEAEPQLPQEEGPVPGRPPVL